MYRDAENSNVSALEFAAQCVSMGENLRFSRDSLRHAFAEALEARATIPNVGLSTDVQTQLTDWQRFYGEQFNIEVDFSNLQVPAHKEDFDRIIVVAQGLTLNRVFEVCVENFPSWKYANNLDKEVIQNDRTSETSYAIRIRDRVEADEELKNLSANQLKEQNIAGITLLERLLYELKYWKETNKHLDIGNITLCAGSRDSGGNVLGVRWHGGELFVHWYYPSDAGSSLRSRAVVF
ncbi:MAG: hypothetical protein HQ536_03695 [Parcubacteria group bacterium]|nr:hypothetical protein [Parcubacteria group bacterium]